MISVGTLTNEFHVVCVPAVARQQACQRRAQDLQDSSKMHIPVSVTNGYITHLRLIHERQLRVAGNEEPRSDSPGSAMTTAQSEYFRWGSIISVTHAHLWLF